MVSTRAASAEPSEPCPAQDGAQGHVQPHGPHLAPVVVTQFERPQSWEQSHCKDVPLPPPPWVIFPPPETEPTEPSTELETGGS